MIWQLIYRTTNALRWGAGKGAALTWEESDKNQGDLEERVWTLENDPPAAVGVSNVTVSGNQLTVWLADATSFGPFTLPVAAFHFLEDGWQPETGLFANDLFVFERTGFYLVLRDHVTADSFDPDAEDTAGPLYQFLLDPFSGSTPKDIPETTDLLYVPELADANTYLIWSGADDLTLLIPTDDDVPFAIGNELHPRQDGAGRIMVVGDDGVTVKPSRPGFATETPWEGANCSVKKVAANTWHYIGPGVEETT